MTEHTTTIKAGISPLSWVNEVIQEFGADTAAETILSEAAAAGYQGVELSRAFPRTPDKLKPLLQAHGLELASGWFDGFLTERSVEEELKAVDAHASLLTALGANVMVYGECGHMADNALDVPFSMRRKLDNFKPYGEKLSEFAKQLKARYGLALSYHHHLMMVAEKESEIGALMDSTADDVGLLLDTGHAYAAGFDYAQLINRYAHRINHIHIKDVRKAVLDKKSQVSFNEGVRAGMFTVLGDGDVNYQALADFLAAGRYQGWVIVEAEQDPSIAIPAPTIARAYDYLTSCILPKGGANDPKNA